MNYARIGERTTFSTFDDPDLPFEWPVITICSLYWNRENRINTMADLTNEIENANVYKAFMLDDIYRESKAIDLNNETVLQSKYNLTSNELWSFSDKAFYPGRVNSARNPCAPANGVIYIGAHLA